MGIETVDGGVFGAGVECDGTVSGALEGAADGIWIFLSTEL